MPGKESQKITVLYEDACVIVCIKPVGVMSEKSEIPENMCDLISLHLKENGENSEYVGVVHRLDFGVGGIMVYAKTKSSAAKLSAQIQANEFQKEYFAVIHGKPEKSDGEMRDLIFKDTHLGKSFVVDRVRKGVKEAILDYSLLGYDEKNRLSLVKIALRTGRTHQIRVQFSSRALPLVGDKKYGAKDNFHSIALFAKSLSFIHPESGEKLTFSALPPATPPWDQFEDTKAI